MPLTVEACRNSKTPAGGGGHQATPNPHRIDAAERIPPLPPVNNWPLYSLAQPPCHVASDTKHLHNSRRPVLCACNRHSSRAPTSTLENVYGSAWFMLCLAQHRSIAPETMYSAAQHHMASLFLVADRDENDQSHANDRTRLPPSTLIESRVYATRGAIERHESFPVAYANTVQHDVHTPSLPAQTSNSNSPHSKPPPRQPPVNICQCYLSCSHFPEPST